MTALFSIILVAVSVCSPVYTFGFITCDDPEYVYENSLVASGLTLESVSWAILSNEVANWHPLTWLSHMLDVELFGMKPAGHHLMSLALHSINKMLHFFCLRKLTGALWHPRQALHQKKLFGVIRG